MRPDKMIFLEQLPKTLRGKLDRRKLQQFYREMMLEQLADKRLSTDVVSQA